MSGARLVALSLAGLLLSGCSHAHPPAADPTAPAAPAASAAPTPTSTPRAHHRASSDQHPRPRRGGEFVVTQLSVSVGPQLWAEEVRTCLRRSSDGPRTVGRADWQAQGVGGRTYPAGEHPRSTPAYPARTSLAPGQCVTGWWQIPVPARQVEAIRFAPGGDPLISWPTLR